jgi:tetratricopeptide (TPR) repeat protein
VDPPFLRDIVTWAQGVLMDKKELEKKARGEWHRTNSLAKFVGSFTNVVRPLDDMLLNWGRRVEDQRRKEGVYPLKEALMPTPLDLNWAFTNYISEVQARYLHDVQYPNEPKQVRGGEIVNVGADGRVQVAGQTAVMAINGLLTKVIFDKNPSNEFYVEESFPLDWMFPHLTPYGIIMKINRQPVAEITEDIVRKDHDFWTRYSERLCGNWISYDTPVKDICEYAERVYLRGNLRGYKGDPKFVRDNDGQKSFSKLRNSIAGMYYWRFTTTTNAEERARVAKEADFAFKQAFAFCPYSPETATRYIQLLAALNRLDDAYNVAVTLQKFDPESIFAQSIVDQVKSWRSAVQGQTQAQSQLGALEAAYLSNTASLKAAFDLVAAYVQTQRTNEAYKILDSWVSRTNADASALLSIANAYVQIGLYARAEPALQKLLQLMPESAEIWYDLAGAQAAQGKANEALKSLGVSLQLSKRRLAADSHSSNLAETAALDGRFMGLRTNPDFLKLISGN